MLHMMDKLAGFDNTQYTRPAILTRIDEDSMLVRIEHEQASFVIEAKNALTEHYVPEVGDQLLVSGESFRCCFIIGVLTKVKKEQKQPQSPSTQSITTALGSVAQKKNINGHEVLSIEDEQGHLLFEYDAVTKKSKLYAAQGDLSLTALQGNIELISGKNIQCTSLGGITLDSATATQLRVSSPDKNYSSVNLTEKGILLSGKRMGMKADKGEFRIKDSVYEGNNVKCVFDRSRLFVGKIETVASRIFERVKNVYRQVDELQQTKAGRVRTLVDGAYQLKSETSYIESTKTVKIDAEKIHLG